MRFNIRGLVLAVGALATPIHAAASLTAFNEADALVCLGSAPGTQTVCDIAHQNPIVFSGTASISGSFGSTGAGAQMSTNITATSGYGVLHAGASSSINLTGSPRLADAVGDAIFEDIITISSTAFNGQPGILFVRYNLDGTISGTGADNSFGEVYLAVGSSLEQTYSALYSSSISGTVNVPRSFTFTYGQPFGIYFDLSALTGS